MATLKDKKKSLIVYKLYMPTFQRGVNLQKKKKVPQNHNEMKIIRVKMMIPYN